MAGANLHAPKYEALTVPDSDPPFFLHPFSPPPRREGKKNQESLAVLPPLPPPPPPPSLPKEVPAHFTSTSHPEGEGDERRKRR